MLRLSCASFAAAAFRRGALLAGPLAFALTLVPHLPAAEERAHDPELSVREKVVDLPLYEVVAVRVANPSPQGTFAMPVSALRYEPGVDVQARNLAEGQADVAIRGGIFSNSGFRVGGSSLLDPQTGHYGAEIPVSPAMLYPVCILTGLENALLGFNSSVGTLAYDWAEIRSVGRVGAAFGENAYRRFNAYEGVLFPGKIGGRTLAADLEYSTSRSDGAIPGGDHEFSRVSGRLQWRGDHEQTDLFVGYQDKFFGWPNLYTPFNWLETERVQTTLVALNHLIGTRERDYLQFTANWRRNDDDYEADRTRPGVFNPYLHRTHATGFSVEARREIGEHLFLRGRGEVLHDSLRSTSLTFGRFNSRTYYQTGALLTQEVLGYNSFPGLLAISGGATFADDNRGSGRISPLAEIAWTPNRTATQPRIYVQMAGASQVSDYTALNSNPASGLFRGNPNLGRTHNTNWETGFRVGNDHLALNGAVFARRDRGLTDWTLQRGVTARFANPVDIDTTGAEITAIVRWKTLTVVGGYGWLEKAEDYRGAVVDASFYALNFPKHRVTAAVTWQPCKDFELRVDNEYRDQQPNFLRRSSPRAILSSASAVWHVQQVKGLTLAVNVDNTYDSAFEEVPAVPASPRQYSASVQYDW